MKVIIAAMSRPSAKLSAGNNAAGAARDARVWLLGLLALLVVLAPALLPPLPEPRVFRELVDDRTFFGVANFLNVVSNAPLLFVGAWGLAVVAGNRRESFADAAEKWPYALLFLAVALTGFGSTYYHLAPGDDAGLMWDRLPMSVAFMSLLAAVLVERVSVKAGLALLVPLAVTGAAAVVHWRWSGNILPYAAVQYGGILLAVALALLFPSRYTRGGDLLAAGAIYALAKIAEVLDAQIYALGHVVSGHTLKHLIAALALWWLLRMLQLRKATRS